MIKTNILAPLFILMLTSVCFAQGNSSVIKKEGKIIDLIARLPETIKADNYVKKHTNGKTHLFTYIADRPSQNQCFYIVKVAEDNGSTYYTHLSFSVDAKNYRIKYHDLFNDKYISLKSWRQHNTAYYAIGR